MIQNKASIIKKNENGAVLILVVISIVVLIAMTALAVDISHLVVAKNELQNAADAGALRGARMLYSDDGQNINTGANQEAYDAAVENASERVAVEVNWTNGNAGDVQRGHWSFATRTFTPNASTALTDLWDVSTEDLDADINFINAVQVTARRNDIPVASIFARIFGFESFFMDATAVAYIGFAGKLFPNDADQPIAICEEALGDPYTCTVGRFINSGSDDATNESGGWTDFNQGLDPDTGEQVEDPCSGGTDANTMKDLTKDCSDGNPGEILLGADMATMGGEVQSAFNNLIDCWDDITDKKVPWPMALPVIICGDKNPGPCNEVVGAVMVNIVWITEGGEDPQYNDIPAEMTFGDTSWTQANCKDDEGVPFDLGTVEGRQKCWVNFAETFKLQNKDTTSAPYAKKNIYFLPSCEVQIPRGVTGGENFGIMAKIPVLVD